jgi:hypothetical protein
MGFLDQWAQAFVAELDTLVDGIGPGSGFDPGAAWQVDGQVGSGPADGLDAWAGSGARQVADVQIGEARRGADTALTEGFRAAQAAAGVARDRLQRIRAEVGDGVLALQSVADTQAGREQMADLLDRKASEVREVVSQALESSSAAAATLGDAVQGYGRR